MPLVGISMDEPSTTTESDLSADKFPPPVRPDPLLTVLILRPCKVVISVSFDFTPSFNDTRAAAIVLPP